MRSFTLPPFIDVEKITPEFKNGLLLDNLAEAERSKAEADRS